MLPSSSATVRAVYVYGGTRVTTFLQSLEVLTPLQNEVDCFGYPKSRYWTLVDLKVDLHPRYQPLFVTNSDESLLILGGKLYGQRSDGATCNLDTESFQFIDLG